jgi:hypothetical protein
VRLHVGAFGPEDLQKAIDRQFLRDIDELATSVCCRRRSLTIACHTCGSWSCSFFIRSSGGWLVSRKSIVNA